MSSFSIPRFHLFEIADQDWFPPHFRSPTQQILTNFWTLRIPLLQPTSPASAAAQILQDCLGDSIEDYVFIEFCAGAGGPTPWICKTLNADVARRKQQLPHETLEDEGRPRDGDSDGGAEAADTPRRSLRKRKPLPHPSSTPSTTTTISNNETKNDRNLTAEPQTPQEGVHFILTDLHPPTSTYHTLTSPSLCPSQTLHYIPTSISLLSPPPASTIINNAIPAIPTIVQSNTSSPNKQKKKKKIPFYILTLSLHHFRPSDLPTILSHLTTSTPTASSSSSPNSPSNNAKSGGFLILELQGRDPSSLVMMPFLPFAIWLYAWWWFLPTSSSPSPSSASEAPGSIKKWRSYLSALFFIYVMPILPFVVVFDGLVSSLRTYEGGEVRRVLDEVKGQEEDWLFREGKVRHTYRPVGGWLRWVGCFRQ